jgi:large subunit ribosomal protein L29
LWRGAADMKTEKIREMEADKIIEKIDLLKKELFNLRFQNSVGQLENTATLSNVKKDIARLYTISKEMNVNIS